jgi:hypothetical protein
MDACGQPPALGPSDMSDEDRQAMEEAALEFAECMRDEGIADFPDPDFSNMGPGGEPQQRRAEDDGGGDGGPRVVLGPFGESTWTTPRWRPPSRPARTCAAPSYPAGPPSPGRTRAPRHEPQPRSRPEANAGDRRRVRPRARPWTSGTSGWSTGMRIMTADKLLFGGISTVGGVQRDAIADARSGIDGRCLRAFGCVGRIDPTTWQRHRAEPLRSARHRRRTRAHP